MKNMSTDFEQALNAGVLVFFILTLIIVLFVVLRVFFLWYWRIDTIVTLLQQQNESLKEIIKNQKQKVFKSGQETEL